jgi:hypothetical protein
MTTIAKEVKVYSEGGKGRKSCSKCYKFVPAVTKICICGFEFQKKDKSDGALEVKTYTEGGKGKKLCLQCKKYVGAVTKICACGFNFGEAKDAKKQAATAAVKAAFQQAQLSFGEKAVINPAYLSLMAGCKSTIIAPAGRCPHKLDSTEPEVVDEWVHKLRSTFSTKTQFLTITGVIYFIHQFFDMFGPEYKKVRDHIEATLGSERTLGLS